MDLGLKDKVALVVGATQGMGRAVAVELAREGCHVLACSRGRAEGDEQWNAVAKPGLETVIAELGAAGAASAGAVVADLTTPGDSERVVREVRERHGRLDVLVNTVGLCEVGEGPLEPDDWWDRSYQSVLMTSVRICRDAVPLMLEGVGGAIVLTSAMSIKHFIPQLAHYSAQKIALAHFTKNLAREYGRRGLRVNAVMPGLILNEQHQEQRRARLEETGRTEDEDFRLQNERWGGVTWSNRFGVPSDIADAVTFLVSERARYINGAFLNVDGGAEYL